MNSTDKFTLSWITVVGLFLAIGILIIAVASNANRNSYERETKARAEETSDKLAACKLIESNSAREACVWVIIKK